MNRIIIRIVLFAISFTFINCTTEECYSCDTEINEWAKNNIETLKTIKRKDFIKLSEAKQKSAFRTFKPYKRKQLWIEKVIQIKSLDLTNDEIKHLLIIEEFIKKYDFSKEISAKEDIFLKSWFNEGKERYNWTVYFLLTGFTNLDNAVKTKEQFKNTYAKKNSSIVNKIVDSPISTDGCDCRWNITCEIVHQGSCSDGCDVTTFGCGWLGMQSCTGDCTG